MRTLRVILPALLVFFSCPLAAQDPPRRDPEAVAILHQAFLALGGSVPVDSTATGTIELTEGSQTERGTIRILTRGLDQTADWVDTDYSKRSVVYSRLKAKESQVPDRFAPSSKADGERPWEMVVSAQSPYFPLVQIAAALTNTDMAIEYAGLEEMPTGHSHRIRVANAFPSNSFLQPLTPFSIRQLWIDAKTGLPLKVSYERWEAGGPGAIPTRTEVSFSDYRLVGGLLYPFTLHRSLNGTPWATISITKVSFNTGLSDADFPVQ